MSKWTLAATAWSAAFLALSAGWSPTFATPPSTPLDVELSISGVPALNASTMVKVTVSSSEAAPGTLVELILPAGAVASPRSWTVNLAPNRAVSFTIAVSVRTSGNVTLSARAIRTEGPGEVWSDMASIPLTIRAVGFGVSKSGWTVDEVPTAVQVTPGDTPILSTAPTPVAALGFSAADASLAPSVDASLAPARFASIRRAGNITITGRWFFTNRSGAQEVADQQVVEIRNGSGGALSPRVFCYTDVSGNFSCGPFANPGGQVKSFLRSWTNFNNGASGADRLGVFAGPEISGACGSDGIDCAYPAQSGNVSCADGATCSLGGWLVGAAEPHAGAMQMTQDLIRVWKKLFFDTKHGPGISSGPGRITYPVPAGHGTHAHVPPGDGWISIEPPSQQSASIVTHEYGHVVMANLWKTFTPTFTPSCNAGPHYINKVNSPGCALGEGWGDFWMWYGTNDPVFHFPGGGAQNIETRDNKTFDAGPNVEGNVAAVMGDLFDTINDGGSAGPADKVADGIQHVWHTVSAQSDNNFTEWFAAYRSLGHAACPALSIVNYNSITTTLTGCKTIRVSSAQSTRGTVSGGGVFATGSNRNVKATPKAGFKFVRWTQGGTQVSTSASYTFALNANRTLVANFAPL